MLKVVKRIAPVTKEQAFELIDKEFEKNSIPFPDIGENFIYWRKCGIFIKFPDKKNRAYLNEGYLEIFGEDDKFELINLRRKNGLTHKI